MTSLIKTLQYPLAFIAGILAYVAAGYARAGLDLYRFFPYPPSDFSGPTYAWWTYDFIGFISVYYWLVFYGALFCILCLAERVFTRNKRPARQILLVGAIITVLVTITVYVGTGLEMALDPRYTNPSARNLLDAITFVLIGGWFVLGWYAVHRRQQTHH